MQNLNNISNVNTFYENALSYLLYNKFKYTKLELHNLKFSKRIYINLHGQVARFGFNGTRPK